MFLDIQLVIILKKDIQIISNEDISELKEKIKNIYNNTGIIHVVVKPKKKHPIFAESNKK